MFWEADFEAPDNGVKRKDRFENGEVVPDPRPRSATDWDVLPTLAGLGEVLGAEPVWVKHSRVIC